MKRVDVLIAAAVVGLSAWAVWAQVDSDPVGQAVQRQGSTKLEVGQPLEDQEVKNHVGGTFRLHSVFGPKATVFYSWSTNCPCVFQLNPRLVPTVERFKPEGVAFVAVAGNAKDTPQLITDTLIAKFAGASEDGKPVTKNGLPPYGMIYDPTQKLCRQLGFREAAQFAVFDANGQLRYRGTFDDSLKKPTTTWLPEAIADVLAGRPVAVPLRPVPGYGCPFGIAMKDCPADPLTAAATPDEAAQVQKPAASPQATPPVSPPVAAPLEASSTVAPPPGK